MFSTSCTRPEEIHYQEIAERMYHLKRSEKGVSTMCEALEYIKGIGIEEGRTEGRAEGKDFERVISIRNLMQSLKWTAQQAMEALQIPVAEREKYAALV